MNLLPILQEAASLQSHHFARGQAAGDFNPDCDAETLAATYTSSVLGAEIQFYQDPEKFPFEGALDGYLDQLKETLTGRPGSGDNT